MKYRWQDIRSLLRFAKPGRLWRAIGGLPQRMRNKRRRAFFATCDRVVAGGMVNIAPDDLRGRYWVPARSDIARRVLFDGSYEPRISSFLSTLPVGDGAIVNIGANIGLYAVHMALTMKRPVIAIEPNPEAVELLRRNIADNELADQVEVVPYCVGEAAQEVLFSIVEGKPEYSSVGRIVHPAVAGARTRTIGVDAKPLDELIGDTMVGLIVMDVEGSEYDILNGAKGFLIAQKPPMVLECSDRLLRNRGSSSRALVDLLRDLGYRVFDIEEPEGKVRYPMEGTIAAIPT